MKREGRQHGMVRTYIKPTNINGPTSGPTAGHFTKVSTKPTNHSKFTGKCARPMCRQCHVTPASKSMGKVKGAHKLTWRVFDDDERSLKVSFDVSATGLLDILGSNPFLLEDD